MKSVIGVFDSHEKAVNAIRQLQNSGFPVAQLTIMGRGEIVEGYAHINSIFEREVGIGAVIGSFLGVLNGVGVLTIPGLGFLVGWGAVINGFVGLEAGLLGGGVVAILTSIGIEISSTTDYEQHLMEGKFIVIIQGTEKQISAAKEVLLAIQEHTELNEQ